MKGNNEFSFNEATMKEIVQHYFDTRMFAERRGRQAGAREHDLRPLHHRREQQRAG